MALLRRRDLWLTLRNVLAFGRALRQLSAMRESPERQTSKRAKAYPGFELPGRRALRLGSTAAGNALLATIHQQLLKAPEGTRIVLDPSTLALLACDVLAWHDYDCLVNPRHPARHARMAYVRESHALVRLPDAPPMPRKRTWRLIKHAKWIET